MDRRRLRWIAGTSGALFAVCLAVFAWQLSVVAAGSAGQDSAEPRVGVLSAATSISPGDRITNLNVAVAAIPKSIVPDGAILADELQTVQGRRIVGGIGRGELLTDLRIAKSTSPLDSVQAGHTAITVAVDPVRALGGEVSAGMRVDLMVDEAIGTVSTIATGVRIISTSVREVAASGSSLMPSSGGSVPDITWVTLEVPDDRVPAVVTASGAGVVYLVLPADMKSPARG